MDLTSWQGKASSKFMDIDHELRRLEQALIFKF